MIHCIVRKPEEYNVILPGGTTGLWHNYGHNPYLFNLMSRISSAFFFYEPGMESIPPEKRIVTLSDVELWKSTLYENVGDEPVWKLLESTSPKELVDLVYTEKPAHLPVNLLLGGTIKDSNPLWFHLYVRQLQFEKYARGKIGGNGKVVKALFRSRLSKEEDTFLEAQKDLLRAAMEERIRNGK